jgi:hypothetical protein
VYQITDEVIERARTAAAKALSQGSSPTSNEFLEAVLSSLTSAPREDEGLLPGVHRSVWGAIWGAKPPPRLVKNEE